MATTVDVVTLHAVLDAERESRELSWRQTAREIGVSASTLSRLANGLKPDVDAFASIVHWLGADADSFMVQEGQEAQHDEQDLVAQLAPLLRARKDLAPPDVEHLEDLIRAAVKRFQSDRASSKR